MLQGLMGKGLEMKETEKGCHLGGTDPEVWKDGLLCRADHTQAGKHRLTAVSLLQFATFILVESSKDLRSDYKSRELRVLREFPQSLRAGTAVRV